MKAPLQSQRPNAQGIHTEVGLVDLIYGLFGAGKKVSRIAK
jgi:hypothetical protein